MEMENRKLQNKTKVVTFHKQMENKNITWINPKRTKWKETYRSRRSSLWSNQEIEPNVETNIQTTALTVTWYSRIKYILLHNTIPWHQI